MKTGLVLLAGIVSFFVVMIAVTLFLRPEPVPLMHVSLPMLQHAHDLKSQSILADEPWIEPDAEVPVELYPTFGDIEEEGVAVAEFTNDRKVTYRELRHIAGRALALQKEWLDERADECDTPKALAHCKENEHSVNDGGYARMVNVLDRYLLTDVASAEVRSAK